MSNSAKNVIYVGITNNLRRRYHEHSLELVPGFTSKYKCHDLVFYEHHYDVNTAIRREKEIKGWRREKKEQLIISMNPDKHNLAVDFEWDDR